MNLSKFAALTAAVPIVASSVVVAGSAEAASFFAFDINDTITLSAAPGFVPGDPLDFNFEPASPADPFSTIDIGLSTGVFSAFLGDDAGFIQDAPLATGPGLPLPAFFDLGAGSPDGLDTITLTFVAEPVFSFDGLITTAALGFEGTFLPAAGGEIPIAGNFDASFALSPVEILTALSTGGSVTATSAGVVVTAIPEPTTIIGSVLFGLGAAAGYRKRRRAAVK